MEGGHRPEEQLSAPLKKVLHAIAFTPNLMGSSEDHRIMYSADYDLLEEVTYKASAVRAFQRKVKNLSRVGKVVDIKIGEIPEWNLLKTDSYSQKKELDALGKLWQSKVITDEEVKHAKSLLKPHLTPPQKLEARKELRFGVMRWTPKEVAEGHIKFRGKVVRLADAITSSGITKVDLVAWVKDKYVEVSNIILWLRRGGKPYAHLPALKKALAEDIIVLEKEGNYLKVAKRMLSIAKAKGLKTDEDKLVSILNSPLGQIYSVVSDLQVLEEFPSVVAPRKREELDLMRDRMAKLFYPEFDHAKDPKKLLPRLEVVLQEETKKELARQHLLPVSKNYRPPSKSVRGKAVD